MDKFNKLYNSIISEEGDWYYHPSREQIEQIVRKEMKGDRSQIKQEDYEEIITGIVDELVSSKNWRDDEAFMDEFWDTRAEFLNGYKREQEAKKNEEARIKVENFLYEFKKKIEARGDSGEFGWSYQPQRNMFIINLNNYGASKVRVSYRNARPFVGKVDKFTEHIAYQMLFYGAKNFDICY